MGIGYRPDPTVCNTSHAVVTSDKGVDGGRPGSVTMCV
jgi:hypothetical protein